MSTRLCHSYFYFGVPFVFLLLFCHDCAQGERQEEMQKRRQYAFRVLMRTRVHKLRDDCLRHRFAIWRVCACGQVCVRE